MRPLPLALVGLLLFATSGALAESSEMRRALAERLFQEGRRALQQQDHALACERLAESHRLDPAGGTVLLLATCLEARGLLASAWSRYHEAAAMARRDHRADRAEHAHERISLIEPRLSKLYLRPTAASAHLLVTLNGTVLPPSAYTSGVPLDAGSHLLRAHAPGHRPWSRRVVVTLETRSLYIDIPRPTPLEPATAPADPNADLGFALLGAGAAGLVASVVAALTALGRDARADEMCPELQCADPRAVAQSRSARAAATAATYSFAVGVTFGVAGAAWIWLPQ